ncbi:MAG: YqgE/AlgH family protein [Bacteroidales bacterium]|nr:YqgE/AlgH family protein [Bacteroidales bacterium]
MTINLNFAAKLLFIEIEKGKTVKDIQKILQLGYNQVIPKSGSVLLSAPFSDEMIFSKAVILLIEHNKTGSFGLILNKPFSQDHSLLLQEIEKCNIPIFLGGPVEEDRLFFIFRGNSHISDAIEFMQGIKIGGDFTYATQLIKEGKLQQKDIRFFLGYTGWDAGQLNQELKENRWVVTELTQDEIFTTEYETLWKIGLDTIGNGYQTWNYLPEFPELN